MIVVIISLHKSALFRFNSIIKLLKTTLYHKVDIKRKIFINRSE